MGEIAKGLYAVENQEEMPCHPNQIYILRWALPNTLDKSELEEAAARILSFSQEQGKWVGVSWLTILNQIKSELEIEAAAEKIRRKNWAHRQLNKMAMKKYRLLCTFTLGLWSLLASRPEIPDDICPPSSPLSISAIRGPKAIIYGVNVLLQKKFLRTEYCFGSDYHTETVFFPTPLLIQRIMQAQKPV